MMIHPSYKKPKINSGNLRTPVQFWEFVPNDGPEPMEEKRKSYMNVFAWPTIPQ